MGIHTFHFPHLCWIQLYKPGTAERAEALSEVRAEAVEEDEFTSWLTRRGQDGSHTSPALPLGSI
jgi:hypothetical protein